MWSAGGSCRSATARRPPYGGHPRVCSRAIRVRCLRTGDRSGVTGTGLPARPASCGAPWKGSQNAGRAIRRPCGGRPQKSKAPRQAADDPNPCLLDDVEQVTAGVTANVSPPNDRLPRTILDSEARSGRGLRRAGERSQPRGARRDRLGCARALPRGRQRRMTRSQTADRSCPQARRARGRARGVPRRPPARRPRSVPRSLDP